MLIRPTIIDSPQEIDYETKRFKTVLEYIDRSDL